MKIISKTLIIPALAGMMVFQPSCKKDLLQQISTTQLPASAFWATEADATTALMGAYSAARLCFDRDYYFDGQGEYTKTFGISNGVGGTFNPTGYGAGFDQAYRYLYGAVDRANYVIDNVNNMLPVAKPTSIANLEAIIGEARLLRGMAYFRLITMWGDVQYIGHVVSDNSEVSGLARLPIAQVKDSIMADFTYAFNKLPLKASALGRAAKPAALAFRGKLQLYWACWNKFGWPELDTFKPDPIAADAAYNAAAADFKSVITEYGLTLYMNGDPGVIDGLGKADLLPNYYYLFIPTSNGNPEMIMVFTHGGGTGSGQGEELLRDFGSRTTEGAQGWMSPRFEIADRYQLLSTGDFAPKLIPMNPSANPAARTTLNSAVNPASYANRDYRMKATLLWDYEMMMGMTGGVLTGMAPFIYQTWGGAVNIGGINYVTINAATTVLGGYTFRKFVRNYAIVGEGRSDGRYNYPVMRLADVYLMYAEATNAVIGPQADAIALVNAIRHRGNLPPLAAGKTAGKVAFFSAIEQERIVELVAEGQRSFDLRRWRSLESVWGPPGSPGVVRQDTYGGNQVLFYQNTSDIVYKQNYIFKIPQVERDRNPNLTQNLPWR